MLKVLNSWGMRRLSNNNENVGRVKKLALENRNHCLWSGVTGRGYHLLAITPHPIKGKDKFGKSEENSPTPIPFYILRLVHLNVPHGQTTNQHNWFDRLPASAGKWLTKTTWKVEFRDILIFRSWRRNCSLCRTFGLKIKWLALYTLVPHYIQRRATPLFPQNSSCH